MVLLHLRWLGIRNVLWTSFLMGGVLLSNSALAAIPASERAALDALYTQNNGPNWTLNSGWGGTAGTECSWAGITCDPTQTHVLKVELHGSLIYGWGGWPANGAFDYQLFGLTGVFPNLSALTKLQVLDVSYNRLTGSIPDLSQLTDLQIFKASGNLLSGSIPDLSGLRNLQIFSASASLKYEFDVADNQLSGPIPNISGLTNLQSFDAYDNQLIGSIPNLSRLKNLQAFNVDSNNLTGTIPSLSGLTNLQVFHVDSNALTGTLPSLSGLTQLIAFEAGENRLSGTIPSLSGLTNLQFFRVGSNQLTGSIPDLSTLTSLVVFTVRFNQLTGAIPSLQNQTHLAWFFANNNLFTGTVPPVPQTTYLHFRAALCPNNLTPSSDPNWDMATGSTPWYSSCATPPSVTITPGAGLHGSITPATAQNIAYGATGTFTVTPDPGYTATVGGTCGGTLGGTTFTTGHVTSDCTVTASFTSRSASSPVGSLPNGATATATLSGGGIGCGFTSQQFMTTTSAPSAYATPLGGFGFTASNCDIGSAITIRITYSQALPSNPVLLKYGPSSTDPSNHWYNYPATFTSNSVVYTVTDGGQGDGDLAANGTIIDPVAIGAAAAAAVPVPIPLLNSYTWTALAIGFCLMASMHTSRVKTRTRKNRAVARFK